MQRRRGCFLGGIIAVVSLCLVGTLAYQIPPIYDSLAWRVEGLIAKVKYTFNPPEEAIFLPQEPNLTPTGTFEPATMPSEGVPTSSPAGNPAESVTQTETITPSPTPTITPTPLPSAVYLKGVFHEYQRWNNCGPATLSMALSYWSWNKRQIVAADYLKPNQRDKNVSPYEMENFVSEETDLRLLWRMGGELHLLKHLIANGFPVMVEKGFTGPSFDGWMGHYEVFNGYDDVQQVFIAQDSYNGPDYHVSYDSLIFDWRAFNFTFLVPYPPEREEEVMLLLGPWADTDWAYRHAKEIAQAEVQELEGLSLYFAWFNLGTSHVRLYEYVDAAYAYDYAFTLYANLPAEERPWRMIWYQTGPYWAYYYSGRYQDVINLANTTLNAMSEPNLEESYYWRGLAREALGNVDMAIDDLRIAVYYNSNFTPGWDQLKRLQGGG
ncbi:MAG: C39 family peptidase [Chloroflexota bacterium]